MNEFDIIKTYFQPLTMGKSALNNDATIIDVPDGFELVVSTDTLNAGIHFMADAHPQNIAHKAIRTNISDIYAMGAKPYAYQMSLALPEKPSPKWLQAFTNALLKDQKEFGVFCSGGDTTSINGPLSISITIMGLVEKGQAWQRSGAQDGDKILISGAIGDAWVGLQILQGKRQTKDNDYFIDKYYKPNIQAVESNDIHAAIDISDGLLADLNHICCASGIQAEIHLKNIPLSPQAQKLNLALEHLITGGDDYKLLLAVPQNHRIEECIPIGHFKQGSPQIIVKDENDKILSLKQTGWSHF